MTPLDWAHVDGFMVGIGVGAVLMVIAEGIDNLRNRLKRK